VCVVRKKMEKRKQGGKITSPTWFGCALVGIHQNYQSLLKTVKSIENFCPCGPPERKSGCEKWV